MTGCVAQSPGLPVDSGVAIDAHPVDARAADASTSTPNDARSMSADSGSPSAFCVDYCNTFATNCTGIQEIPGGQDCLSFCAGFTQEAADCRIVHCRLSGPGSPWHCEHALGIGECVCAGPGTPC